MVIKRKTDTWCTSLDYYIVMQYLIDRRNTHGVALETIQRMIERFEHNVSVESILPPSLRSKTGPSQKPLEHQQQQPQQHLHPSPSSPHQPQPSDTTDGDQPNKK